MVELSTDDPATKHYLTIESKLSKLPGAQTRRSATDDKGNTVQNALGLKATPITPPLSQRIFAFCKRMTKWLEEQADRPNEDELWNSRKDWDGASYAQAYLKDIQPWTIKLVRVIGGTSETRHKLQA